MAVYVDDFNAKYRGMIMCHMLADTTEELLQMVDKIGVKRKWIQDAGTHGEHFDICLAKKKLAIQNGALPVTARWLANFRCSRDPKLKFLTEKIKENDNEHR